MFIPDQIGARYAQRWLDRSDQGQVDRVREMEGTFVSKEIDYDLLRYLDHFAHDSRNDESAKVAVRQGFFSSVRGQ